MNRYQHIPFTFLVSKEKQSHKAYTNYYFVTKIFRRKTWPTETSKIRNSSQQKTCFYSFDCCCWQAYHIRPTATVERIKKRKDILNVPPSRHGITEKKTTQLSRDVTGCSVKVRQRNILRSISLPYLDRPPTSLERYSKVRSSIKMVIFVHSFIIWIASPIFVQM